jgi:hypothetical protein
MIRAQRLLLVAGCLFLPCSRTAAQMIQNNAIGNDPNNERLCALRAKGATVPFEIDSRYVVRVRALHPDATFIAIDGISPQLVVCYLREGTGRYEPDSYSPEQSYWHLIKPKQFEPGINTQKGISMAANVCFEEARARFKHPNFDHSVYSAVVEVNLGSLLYHPGAQIAGKSAARYDIAVEGTSFYKAASGSDLAEIKFACLLSPTLELKAIQVK